MCSSLTLVLREGLAKHLTQFSVDWEKSNGGSPGAVVHEGVAGDGQQSTAELVHEA